MTDGAMNTTRTYLTFDPSKGYPVSEHLWYECLRCGQSIPSLPLASTHCTCRNIMCDVDAGRLSVQDHDAYRLYTTE